MVLIKKKLKKTKEEILADKEQQKLRQSGIQDDFQKKGFELVSYAQKHKKMITIVACTLLVGSFLWVMGNNNKRQKNESAAIAYFSAANIINSKQNITKNADLAKGQQEALESFIKISEEYSGSKVANLALLQRGNMYTQLKNYTEAIKAYDQFLNKTENVNNLRPLAYMGLGYAHEELNQLQKAINSFEDLLKTDFTPQKDVVLWHIARLAYRTKDYKKAKNNIELIKKNFSRSILIGQINELESSINTKLQG